MSRVLTGDTDHAPARLLGVSGGSNGFEARYGEVRALAEEYAATAAALAADAARDATLAGHPALLASGALAPGSFARAETEIAGATTGPRGLAFRAAAWGTLAAGIRLALTGLEHADDFATSALATLRLGSRLLPGPGNPIGGGGTVLEDGAMLADVLAPVELPTRGPAGWLAATTPQAEPPEVTAHPGLWPGALTDAPPRDLGALIDRLGAVHDLSPGDDHPLNGTMAVQTLTHGDEVRHVVYLPGMDRLWSSPWLPEDAVQDQHTSLQLLAGRPNGYLDGIEEAMRQAGISPDDPVLVAGYSQGGMAAAALAAESSFNVTDAVTLGAPTAHVGEYAAGNVLSLEAHGDPAPLLDGADNPGSRQQVTVQFAAPGVLGPYALHDLDTYRAGTAATVAAAGDRPSVAASLAGLEAFLGPGEDVQVSGQVYRISRPSAASP